VGELLVDKMLHMIGNFREEKEAGAAISSKLQTDSLGRKLLYLAECTSTNDVAKKVALESTNHGFTIVANSQTNGRGRHGRKWESPKGGIWMTVILRPPFGSSTLQGLPLIGAVSIVNSIRSQLTIDARLRWPNDVMVNGYKLAGTIAESHWRGDSLQFVLLGMGVNANFNATAITEANTAATTLLDIHRAPIDRTILTCSILQELERLLSLAERSEENFLALIRTIDCSTGSKVRVQLSHGMINGVFKDYISANVVRISSKTETVIVETGSALLVDYET